MDIRSLLERHIWILNLILIFWLCYFVAGAVNAYLSSRYLSSEQVIVERGLDYERSLAAPFQGKTHSIIERNIFNVNTGWDEKAEFAPLGDGAGEEIKETTLRAKLLGVIYFYSGANLNRATIRLIKENDSEVYREGDELTKDIQVAKIETKRILLRRSDGQLEELSLEEDDATGSGRRGGPEDHRYVPRHLKMSKEERTEALREKRKALGIDNRIRRVSDTEYQIERSAITDSLSDLATLFTQMRLVPNFVGEGDQRTVEGYRVFRVKPGSVFQKLGIRNGDIILDINGVKADNPEKSFELLQQLRYENNFSLTLKRNDNDIDMNYNITD
jgi:type II secretion system protein C